MRFNSGFKGLMHWFSVTQIKCKDYCYQVTTQLQLVVISSSSKIT